VRQLVLGEANPAAYPCYTNKFCFRTLIPMDAAREVLGEERSSNRYMYNGPDAHIITYPVAKDTLLNALFVITDPNPWPLQRHTASGTKQEAIEAYAAWHPTVRALVDLFPEKLDKWAIFDMHDHPAPYYNAGAVALAGDAAHASGPHLGSGAGFGIEDGLVLASVLEAADAEVGTTGRSGKSKQQICRDALAAYNAVRYDRDQWLPGATRESVELFQWRDKEVGSDHDKFLPRISRLYHKIWDNDIDEMVQTAVSEFKSALVKQSQPNL
jgi:salicylate hydroxylase